MSDKPEHPPASREWLEHAAKLEEGFNVTAGGSVSLDDEIEAMRHVSCRAKLDEVKIERDALIAAARQVRRYRCDCMTDSRCSGCDAIEQLHTALGRRGA